MNEKLLSIKDIADLVGYSLSHTKRYIITQPEFPKPIKLVPKGAPRWKHSDLLKYFDTRKEI